MSEDPAPLPTAFCAPGNRTIAMLTLAARGEQVAEIIEHPYLEGNRNIILMSPDLVNGKLAFDPDPATWKLGR